jgi:hypothetical protein
MVKERTILDIDYNEIEICGVSKRSATHEICL